MTHALAGRPQTAEHIARRTAAVVANRATWSDEKRRAVGDRIAESNRQRDPEVIARFAHNRRGKPAWWANSDMTPSGPRRSPEEKRVLVTERARLRRERNPGLRVHERVSAMVHKALGPQGKDGRTWESLVGYTRADLMAHLESRFVDGMTWDNAGQWHIDHIIPRSAFTFESPSDPEFRACWALANLQPLWAVDNLRKAARRPVQA